MIEEFTVLYLRRKMAWNRKKGKEDNLLFLDFDGVINTFDDALKTDYQIRRGSGTEARIKEAKAEIDAKLEALKAGLKDGSTDGDAAYLLALHRRIAASLLELHRRLAASIPMV